MLFASKEVWVNSLLFCSSNYDTKSLLDNQYLHLNLAIAIPNTNNYGKHWSMGPAPCMLNTNKTKDYSRYPTFMHAVFDCECDRSGNDD